MRFFLFKKEKLKNLGYIRGNFPNPEVAVAQPEQQKYDPQSDLGL